MVTMCILLFWKFSVLLPTERRERWRGGGGGDFVSWPTQ